MERQYIAIDLKSFYASVECVERGLDPMRTHLVVADAGRTEKTICLAVSPALKAYGIPGRARLFEVVQKVAEVNAARLARLGGKKFSGKTVYADALAADSSLALDYIAAPPQMAHYMEVSTRIYKLYLKYIAPEDIHVYSIDEVFIDATDYMRTYGVSARELAQLLVREVLENTGITATVGIGTNLYLCKVALDIGAKHAEPDENGVRMAELDEMSYRRNLWAHRPLRDFWRVGPGIAEKLEAHGLYTMGDVARCSLGSVNEYYNEDLLYKLFGVNAELLIDHAWGWEPCTIADIKAYRPENNSISSGQVLSQPYDNEKTRLVVREMADLVALELLDKGFVTDQLVLTIGYDVENLKKAAGRGGYKGETVKDRYGREIPKHGHGTANLGGYTCSVKRILQAVDELFARISDRRLTVRRINLTANHVLREENVPKKTAEYRQLDIFSDLAAEDAKAEEARAEEARERKMQETVLSIKKKFGKNAILRGMNLQEGATAKERNGRIGGHKA